jgi:putative solute:sodium symporter small subunit
LPAHRATAYFSGAPDGRRTRVGGGAVTDSASRRRIYWRRNLKVSAALMGLWFTVTFVVSFFARELSFTFFGWPFSFWMAAQGSLLVYGGIIWFYAHYMSRLDVELGFEESDD